MKKFLEVLHNYVSLYGVTITTSYQLTYFSYMCKAMWWYRGPSSLVQYKQRDHNCSWSQRSHLLSFDPSHMKKHRVFLFNFLEDFIIISLWERFSKLEKDKCNHMIDVMQLYLKFWRGSFNTQKVTHGIGDPYSKTSKFMMLWGMLWLTSCGTLNMIRVGAWFLLASTLENRCLTYHGTTWQTYLGCCCGSQPFASRHHQDCSNNKGGKR